MSETDTIFLHTPLALGEAADRLAQALGLTRWDDEAGRIDLSRERPGEGSIGGRFAENPLRPGPATAADEVAVMDGYEYSWHIDVDAVDEDALRSSGRLLFADLTRELPWPSLYVAHVDTLLAAFRPETGLVDFGPGVSPDGDNREEWAPFDVARR